jgi:hypothetical protein
MADANFTAANELIISGTVDKFQEFINEGSLNDLEMKTLLPIIQNQLKVIEKFDRTGNLVEEFQKKINIIEVNLGTSVRTAKSPPPHESALQSKVDELLKLVKNGETVKSVEALNNLKDSGVDLNAPMQGNDKRSVYGKTLGAASRNDVLWDAIYDHQNEITSVSIEEEFVNAVKDNDRKVEILFEENPYILSKLDPEQLETVLENAEGEIATMVAEAYDASKINERVNGQKYPIELIASGPAENLKAAETMKEKGAKMNITTTKKMDDMKQELEDADPKLGKDTKPNDVDLEGVNLNGVSHSTADKANSTNYTNENKLQQDTGRGRD